MRTKVQTETTLQLRELAIEFADTVQTRLAEALVSIVLYGSVARGEATALSDIDLLVIADELPSGRFARQDVLRPVDQVFQARLDHLRSQGFHTGFQVLLTSPAEAAAIRPLYLDMVEDAVILYDREGFFAGILARLRVSLARLGSRRLTQGAIRYWDLKPDFKPGEVFEI